MGKQTGCYEDLITANPNRPTVSNPAHVTQFGVMELEYGPDRTWPQEGISQTSGNGLLKFGLLCDIELRWNTTSFLSQTDATGTHSTFGDNWLGTEIRFHRQSTWLPTMAIQLLLQNTLGQSRKWFGHRARGSLIHFRRERNYRALHFRLQFYPVPDRTTVCRLRPEPANGSGIFICHLCQTQRAGRGNTRFPQKALHQKFGLVRLTARTASFPWATA